METKPARMPLAMHVRSWTPSNHIDSAPAVSAPPLYSSFCEVLKRRQEVLHLRRGEGGRHSNLGGDSGVAAGDAEGRGAVEAVPLHNTSMNHQARLCCNR